MAEQTVGRWRQEPAFQAEVDRILQPVRDELAEALAEVGPRAIRRLALLMDDDLPDEDGERQRVPATVQATAASTIARLVVPARSEVTGRDGAPLQVEVLQVSTAVLDALGDEAEE